MAFIINVLLLIVVFILGFILGNKTFHKKAWSYDVILICLAITSTWIGISTLIINFGEVYLRLSQGLQMIFLGILVRRLLHLHLKSAKRN
jgi:hypothetical protein